jgi:branched-chain amino acid transport system ATP-binding protein
MSEGSICGAPPTLDVRGLVKRYGGILATDHVDLRVERGEIHALIGPNGAGKTTLVHQLAGSLQPDAGVIRFEGDDITRLSQHRRALRGVARSHQITSLFGPCSVLHNLLLGVLARKGSGFEFRGSPFNDTALVFEALQLAAEFGLTGQEGEFAATLSHGQKRRLELALAVAARPRLLLLDEPLAGMGASDTEAMVELMAGLRAHAAVVLVEHDMHAVFRLADRVTVLAQGKVIASDTTVAIRRSVTVRKAYLGEEQPT